MKRPLITLLFGFIFYTACGQQIDTTLQRTLTNAFYNSDELEKKQSLFNELQQKFPESKDNNHITDFDQLKRILAINYLMMDDTTRSMAYLQLVKDKVVLAGALNNIASHLVINPPLLNKAFFLSAFSIKAINEAILDPEKYRPVTTPVLVWRKELGQQKNILSFTYANILSKRGDTVKALQYSAAAYKASENPSDESALLYAKLLRENRKPEQAIRVIEKTIRSGNQSVPILNEFKNNYILVHGNDVDYDIYLKRVLNAFEIKLQERLKKQMIDLPAADFNLKDLEGKEVSLKNLRGKIIILDFWATWCQPCIKAFPGLHKTKEYFKNNPDVQFIFIDTWENSKDPAKDVTNFLLANKYSFWVLIDENEKNGRQQVVSNKFKVSALPTQFIIDKNGKIRFRNEGYPGTTEELYMELIKKIEMLIP